MTRTLLACTLLALAACGGSDSPAGTTPASGETVASGDDEATPPVQPSVGCDKEVALTCADGFIDGCLSKLTLVHVCMAASEEKAGPPPCEREIARQCPDGQMDACLATPAMAATHVCVVAPK